MKHETLIMNNDRLNHRWTITIQKTLLYLWRRLVLNAQYTLVLCLALPLAWCLVSSITHCTHHCRRRRRRRHCHSTLFSKSSSLILFDVFFESSMRNSHIILRQRICWAADCCRSVIFAFLFQKKILCIYILLLLWLVYTLRMCACIAKNRYERWTFI